MVGSTVTFTIHVVNRGPGTAPNVVLTDKLPAGLVFVRAASSRGMYDHRTGQWSVGTLANGEEATLRIIARVRKPARIVNAAVVRSGAADPDLRNNISVAALRGLLPPGMISKRLFLSMGRVPASIKVKSPLNSFDYTLVDPITVLDESEKWEKTWNELFLKR